MAVDEIMRKTPKTCGLLARLARDWGK
jgi:hypothetical protein